ncbi:hypothetical protein BKA62DRAFT_741274 [Auriculariales sp. MPI-PUGE-AT-0066]|nr:hypothetical protein BKA62DRAFT_741274 [Auriculariales sp. MPI-PUGE-AT-0066]
MSITFNLAQHPANSLEPRQTSAEDLLGKSAHGLYSNEFKKLFSSSFGNPSSTINSYVSAKNGLVNTVLDAYNKHHALVLRPDDVWLTVMTQFSFFVNAHAEQLRGRFVAHEGKETIRIEMKTSSALFDGASLAPIFADELAKRVTDQKLRGWLVPDFSTTTDNDRVVGSAVLMGAMKKYFSYEAYCMCGIPRVTLEGTREDWEELVRRADKIAEYGDECVLWHRMLTPILRRFVATFDDPTFKNPETRQFWENMVQYDSPGSGIPYMSGWVTAFCSFSDEGKWIHRNISSPPMMDGVSYPRVGTDSIPPGYVTVDIKLDDNGKVYDAEMVAGLASMRVVSSGDSKLSSTGQNDTLAPAVSWWLIEKLSDQERAARK